MAVLAVGGGGLLERHTRGCYAIERSKEAVMEVYVGLDLSRKRLDWQAVDASRRPLADGAVMPDREGLARLVLELGLDVVAGVGAVEGGRVVPRPPGPAGWGGGGAQTRGGKGLGPAGRQNRK